jgi:hypothetical protein
MRNIVLVVIKLGGMIFACINTFLPALSDIGIVTLFRDDFVKRHFSNPAESWDRLVIELSLHIESSPTLPYFEVVCNTSNTGRNECNSLETHTNYCNTFVDYRKSSTFAEKYITVV